MEIEVVDEMVLRTALHEASNPNGSMTGLFEMDVNARMESAVAIPTANALRNAE